MAKRIKYATNEQIIEHIKHQVSIDVAPFIDKERSTKRALVVDTSKLNPHQMRQIASICNGSIVIEGKQAVMLGSRGKWLYIENYGGWGHCFMAIAK